MAAEMENAVLESLDSEDPNVLRAACQLAGYLKLKRAERGLLKALAHKAWQVQAEACRALGLLGQPGPLPYLRRLLKASDSELRSKILAAAAVSAKAARVGGGGENQEEAHPEVQRSAAIAINRLNPKVCEEALLVALGSDQANLLTAAMAGLANLESENGCERMVELLAHEDPKVRSAAAASLGRLRWTGAVDGLLKHCKDDDPHVRREAAIALNHLKDNRAIPFLAGLMSDADATVRRVAAIALGNIRRPREEAVEALRKGLTDRDADVRSASLKALANLKASDTLEEVVALMQDTHDPVKAAAAVAAGLLLYTRQNPDYSFD
jgi:HEAT repeat protein